MITIKATMNPVTIKTKVRAAFFYREALNFHLLQEVLAKEFRILVVNMVTLKEIVFN